MAGLDPDALIPAAFASPAKHAELVALLRAYEQFRSDHKREDLATVYQEALRYQDWCPIQSQDCWTELPDANWNPLQRRLVKSYEARATDADASDDDRAFATERAEQARKVRAWLTSLVDSIPAPATDGTVALQAVVGAVLAFLDGPQQRARPSDRGLARGLHRRPARAGRLLLCAPGRAALRAGARAVAHRRARTPTARPSLRVQPVAVGLRRPRPSLHRRARSRKGVCSLVRRRTPCCWTRNGRGSRTT